MWKWLTRVWEAGDAAVRAHAVYALFGIITSAFTTLAVAMSVIANWVTNLHDTYGLGGVIFVGIGAACVIVLVISAALVAWRLFNPLPKTQPSSGGAVPENVKLDAVGISGLGGLDGKVAELERKIDANTADIEQTRKEIAEAANQQTSNYRALEGIVGTVEDKIDRQSAELDGRLSGLTNIVNTTSNSTAALTSKLVEYAADGKMNSDALSELRAAQGRTQGNFDFLIKALHARDAAARIKECDKIVRCLGSKLLAATGYENQAAWRADYVPWENALATIDTYVEEWLRKGHNTPFLFIRPAELQQCPDNPPDSMREITVAYKTVAIAQRRYLAVRENIETKFETLGALLL
jgi:hypothetical protein